MGLKSILLAVVSAVVFLSRADAAVVLNLVLDPATTAGGGSGSTEFGTGSWHLYALDRNDDSLGISLYSVRLNDVTSVYHRTPNASVAVDDALYSAGFNMFRSATDASWVHSSQNLPDQTPFKITGLGQTAGEFSSQVTAINPNASVIPSSLPTSWGNYDTAPAPIDDRQWLFLAEGTYALDAPPTISHETQIAVYNSDFSSRLSTLCVGWPCTPLAPPEPTPPVVSPTPPEEVPPPVVPPVAPPEPDPTTPPITVPPVDEPPPIDVPPPLISDPPVVIVDDPPPVDVPPTSDPHEIVSYPPPAGLPGGDLPTEQPVIDLPPDAPVTPIDEPQNEAPVVVLPPDEILHPIYELPVWLPYFPRWQIVLNPDDLSLVEWVLVNPQVEGNVGVVVEYLPWVDGAVLTGTIDDAGSQSSSATTQVEISTLFHTSLGQNSFENSAYLRALTRLYTSAGTIGDVAAPEPSSALLASAVLLFPLLGRARRS